MRKPSRGLALSERSESKGGRRRRANRLRRTDQPRLLDRILDTPHLAQVVPRLQPEVLHRVIQTCGLEDCAELVALATSDQLERVFDLDLWRAGQPGMPGMEDQLDADRFGLWLDVLMECGATIAAQKIVGVDVDLVIAALAQHVLVFDRAAVSTLTTEGEEVAESRRLSDGLGCEVGNYMIEARRTDAWDTIVALLLVLDAEHPDYFHRVMRGCRSLSNSTPEIDGLHDLLDDSEQDMFDLAVDRERRREKQGYVTPAQARAFLQSARRLQLRDGTAPRPSPIAHAYFRAIEPTPPAETATAAAVVDVLREAGVLNQQPRALLDGPQDRAPRLARIHAQMQFARDTNPVAHSIRTEEFAYLANAIVAGCSIQARPFTPREASDAAAAICNLGLENWPTEWLAENDRGTALPEDFLVSRDLISVFQVGWTVLHADVGMYAAEQLIQVLTDLRTNDRHIQAGLDALRLEMTRHWRAGAPWRARDALDVMVMLDQTVWATLLGLIDECPVLHAGISASRGSATRTISATAFEFISETSQIVSVRDFFASLPETLR